MTCRRYFFTLRLLLTLCTFAWALRVMPCQAADLTVLHTFGAGGLDNLNPANHKNADGARPEAPLMQGRDGSLYGTTPSGGAQGTGVIFKINPDGTAFTILHSFGPLEALYVNATNTDGAWPSGALIQADNGALYGTTTQGGPGGSGTVFTLNPDGSGFKILHTFSPKGEQYVNADGARATGLVLASDGLLYGAAMLGGPDGKGVVFKLKKDGKGFQTLHVFHGVTDEGNKNDGGALPSGDLVFGRDGALYGTTNIGGKYGYGVIYSITTDGKRFVLLHHFQRTGPGSETNGAFPEGPLTASADGSLYGAARQGGVNDSGVLFRMSQDGTGFTLLHTFAQSGDDGGWLPGAAPLLGSDDCLYGVTSVGGANGVGTLFQASRDGSQFIVLHAFSLPDAAHHNAEGSSSDAKLIQGHDGALYGVASAGGQNGNGTVFRLMLPQDK